MDWADSSSWVDAGSWDVLLGSDLIYDSDIAPLLVDVVSSLLSPDGSFLMVCGKNRQGVDRLFSLFAERGFACAQADPAPNSFLSNPLKSRDDKELKVHFNELEENSFGL